MALSTKRVLAQVLALTSTGFAVALLVAVAGIHFKYALAVEGRCRAERQNAEGCACLRWRLMLGGDTGAMAAYLMGERGSVPWTSAEAQAMERRCGATLPPGGLVP